MVKCEVVRFLPIVNVLSKHSKTNMFYIAMYFNSSLMINAESWFHYIKNTADQKFNKNGNENFLQIHNLILKH